ncbi:MAG: cytochrome c maturation protein CcmE [Acidiferrobacterales bacterium]|nr:cytochrome c maturation protein CcmE [Acidiferrobacterales bacterium]
MTPKRKQRLMLVGLLILGVATAATLTLTALQDNINLFFSPTEVKQGKAPEGRTFRLGGMVVDGSVERSATDLNVSFDLTDTAEVVTVKYAGILPDLFREGQGIVTTGSIENGIFVAREVLAKHDENYMPPEVTDALKKANAKQYQTNGGVKNDS